jgi:hypothetical protein
LTTRVSDNITFSKNFAFNAFAGLRIIDGSGHHQIYSSGVAPSIKISKKLDVALNFSSDFQDGLKPIWNECATITYILFKNALLNCSVDNSNNSFFANTTTLDFPVRYYSHRPIYKCGLLVNF